MTAQAGSLTPDGRTVLFSIVQNFRTPQAEYQSGWAQSNSLPITVSYNAYTQDIDAKPIKELEGLRAQKLVDIKNKSINEANQLISNIKSDMLEIILEFDKPKNSTKYGIKVRRSPKGEEETLLYYDSNEGAYYVDRNKSSIDPDVRSYGIQGGKVDLNGENVKLHIFVDRSIIESFINYKKKLTTRVYTGRYDSLGIQLWADGDVNIKSLEVWQMNALNGQSAKPVYIPDNWDTSKYTDVTLPPNHDFSAGNLSGWIAEGQAFTDAHVTKQEKFWDTIYFNPSRRIPGGYHLWGFNEKLGGDKLTGTIRTKNFILGGNGKIDFLLSGGKDQDKLYAALVRVRDGKILFKQTGFNYEEYQRIRWDASAYIGEELYFILVDNSTDDFGHLNLDDVHIPIKIVAQPPSTSQTSNPTQQQPKQQDMQSTEELQSQQQQNTQPTQESQQSQKNNMIIEINPLSNTTVEFDKNIKFKVPADAIKGSAPQIKISKVEKHDKDINIGSLIIKPVELSIEKGNIIGNVQMQVQVEPNTIKENQVAIALIFDEKKGKWVPVSTKKENDTVVITTNKTGKIAVVASSLEDVYKDIKKENWAYDTFKKAITNGLITGYDDMTIRPEKQVSFAEAAVIAQRAFEIKPKKEGSLSKVPQWANESIKALLENNIIDAVKDSNTPLTRLDACIILIKILEQKGINNESAQVAFTDVYDLPENEVNYVEKAYKLGIVKGYNDNTFKPKKVITRAELLTMLIRTIEIIKY